MRPSARRGSLYAARKSSRQRLSHPIMSRPEEQKELIRYFRDFLTDERWERLNRVLDLRTRRIAVVLEDIYQPHNASAVLRSCDCFGVQDIHVIENRNDFDPSSGVTIGADRWLSLHRYGEEGEDNTRRCLSLLRERGYRLVATTPHEEDMLIEDLPLDRPLALMFGAELEGLSEKALEAADLCARVPMYGFSESYNISVSAALCLYELSRRMRREREDWPLDGDEKRELLLEWMRESIRASDLLEERFRGES